MIGLTKTLALELANHGVTATCGCPTGVDTPMISGTSETYGEEILEKMGEIGGPPNVLNTEGPTFEARDVNEPFVWLSSDAARYGTGIALTVDAVTVANWYH